MRERRHGLRRALDVTLSVLSWILLVVVVGAVALVLVPTIAGFQLYAITSGSMKGTFDPGALVYDKPVPVAELKVGDIITYLPPPDTGVKTLVTHRIVLVSTTEGGQRVFQTKGDANETADPWQFTLDADTQPRYVFHIPYVGYPLIWLGGSTGGFLLLLLPAIGIAVSLVLELVRTARGPKRRPRPAEA